MFVRANTQHAAGVPVSTMAALMLAVFAVSIGYGVVLPLLPYLIERLSGPAATAVQISRHTGLLTGVYAFALFVFAPVWGRLSDRLGRRRVLLAGVIGFGVTMLAFSFVERLTAVYAERFLSGLFSAAVTPVAAAAIGDLVEEDVRGRRLAFLSMAGIAGFLLGPMLGVYSTRLAGAWLGESKAIGSLTAPLIATAGLAFLVSAAVAISVPAPGGHSEPKKVAGIPGDPSAWTVPILLLLTFVVSSAIGVFEVGLALRGKQDLGLTSYQIAMMFTECSLIMFVIQGITFSPWVKPRSTRWLIAPALAMLAAGMFFVPRASDFTLMLIVIGAVAAGAGVLSPILTYWISAKAGSAQGWELGKQTAASSLGMTLGSALGGLLFNVASLPGASFIVIAVLVVLGFLLSLWLPHLLVHPHYSKHAVTI